MYQILATCIRNHAAFTIEPTDVTAREGDTVIFTCVAENITNNGYSISWSMSRTQNHEIVAGFDGERNLMTSELRLRNISKPGCYVTCNLNISLQRGSGEYEWNCFSTKEATLNVLYFPKRNQISCSPHALQPLQEDSSLSLTCEVARCKPAVDIYWKFNYNNQDGIQLPRPRLIDNGLTRISRLVMPVSKQMHLRSLICIVTSELAFPETSLQCAVGPIEVVYAPRVFVDPTRLDMKSYQTQLTCLADGHPANFTFSWSCSVADIFIGCEGNSQIIDLSVNKLYKFPTSGQVYVVVTCAVSNLVGRREASSHVKVERQDFFEGPTDRTILSSPSCIDRFSNITIHGQYKGLHTSQLNSFQCTFHGHATALDDFQTQLMNDTAGAMKLDFKLERELPVSNFSFQLWNISVSNVNENVVCEITSCNQSQLTFATTSSHYSSLDITTSSLVRQPETAHTSDPVTNANNKVNSSANWQIATITITSIVAIAIFIAGTIAMTKFILWQWPKSCSNRYSKDCKIVQKIDDQHDKPSALDPIYEVPMEQDVTSSDTFIKPPDDTISTYDYQQVIYHTYDESREKHSLTPSLASENSSGLNDMQISHVYYATEGLQKASNPSERVIYDNECVVRMHIDHERVNRNIKLPKPDNDVCEVPVPQIPLWTNKDN